MSMPKRDDDDMLPVTTQSHSSRGPSASVKDDALVAPDDSRRIGDCLPQICPERLRCQSADDEFESEKHAIYRHSLFPLLALLFERCEQATHAPDCAALTSLKADIQLFVQHQQQRDGKFSSDDPEVDSLMLRAIQTLRIHLLELEKVNELCKDFCSRYIACLRAKMQNEQLLHLDSFDAECMSAGGMTAAGGAAMSPRWHVMSPAFDGHMSSVTGQEGAVRQDSGPRSTNGNSNHSQQDTVMSQQVANMKSFESTERTVNNTQDNRNTSTPATTGALSSLEPMLLMAGLDDIEDDDLRSQHNKRGLLPPQTTHILKSWLFQHLLHPYPSEEEKRLLASQTNLTVLQISNWFINARRCIVQPPTTAAVAADTAADTQELSAAKRMKMMQPSDARSQFWSAPLLPQPLSTTVGYTSHTAAADETQLLSSVPSSTTYECDFGNQMVTDPQHQQQFTDIDYPTSSVLHQRTGTPGQLVTESDDVAGVTQPGHPSVAGQSAEPSLCVAGSSGADVRETVIGSSSDMATELPPVMNTSRDSSAVDKP